MAMHSNYEEWTTEFSSLHLHQAEVRERALEFFRSRPNALHEQEY